MSPSDVTAYRLSEPALEERRDPEGTSRTTEVPVLIVGAGLAGLTTAVFLGLHGVRALVVERHLSTSTQPKARGQNSTVMESLRLAGIDEEVRAAGFDIAKPMEIVIGPTVLGRPYKTLVESFDFDTHALTPTPMAMTSQEGFEQILLRRARELGAEVSFGTELSDIVADENGVTAELVELGSGTSRSVRADYLVAADGWRSRTRGAVGIGVHGHGTLSRWVAALVRVDLGAAFADREFTLVYLQNPALQGGTGAFVSTDEPGRYVFTVPFDPSRGETFSDFTEADCVEQVRIAVGVDDLAVEVLDLDETEYAHRVADRFRAGRVVVAGDAAHVMPPTGGQGGNTAVQDGIDLGWKLAMIINGQAGPGLLDSYDAERRPFAERVAEYQYQNLQQRMSPDGVDAPGGEAGLEPLDLLFGARVVGGAVCTEPGDDHELFERVRKANGRPGSRAPHVWLQHDVETISTRDLFGRCFVILTADPSWRRIVQRVSDQLGVPLEVRVIGEDDLVDQKGDWLDRYGINRIGASLVRPDGYVAWRSTEAADERALTDVLRQILSLADRR